MEATESPTGVDALRRAVEIVGDQGALGRIVNRHQSAVSLVLTGKTKKVPAEWCVPIERETGGAVTRQQLRPDLWPDEAERAA